MKEKKADRNKDRRRKWLKKSTLCFFVKYTAQYALKLKDVQGAEPLGRGLRVDNSDGREGGGGERPIKKI